MAKHTPPYVDGDTSLANRVSADWLNGVQDKLYDQWISVKDYGAVGDGSTDDTTAIQNALNDAATSRIWRVDCSGAPVSWKVSNITVPKNVILDGGGHFGTITYLGTTIKGFMAGVVVTLEESAELRNVNVTGISDGTATVSVGVYSDSPGSTVQNVAVNGVNDQGILYGPNAIACRIKDVFVLNAVMNRTRAQLTGAVEVHGTDHYLDSIETGCSLTAGKSSASFYLVGLYLASTSNFVVSCHGEFSDIGIYVSSVPAAQGGNRLVNCRSDLCWGDGYYIASSNNQISNCTSLNNGRDASNTYYGFNALGVGNTFSNCISTVTTATLMKSGFNDGTSGGPPEQYNVYNGCISSGHGTKPVTTVDYLGAAYSVQGVTIQVTSGAKIDVGQVSNIRLAYAGATNVDEFQKGINGQVIRILGDNNVSLVTGVNINTNTGASRLMAYNQVYTFTNFLGQWYENTST